jgi:hypothetical protein
MINEPGWNIFTSIDDTFAKILCVSFVNLSKKQKKKKKKKKKKRSNRK